MRLFESTFPHQKSSDGICRQSFFLADWWIRTHLNAVCRRHTVRSQLRHLLKIEMSYLAFAFITVIILLCSRQRRCSVPEGTWSAGSSFPREDRLCRQSGRLYRPGKAPAGRNMRLSGTDQPTKYNVMPNTHHLCGN